MRPPRPSAGRSSRRPLDPPIASPLVGTMPDGDWVVRVEASFETGMDGPDGLVVAEFFFRVRVGPMPAPTPSPEPTPAVTPAVACGPPPAAAEDVELALTVAGADRGRRAGRMAPRPRSWRSRSATLRSCRSSATRAPSAGTLRSSTRTTGRPFNRDALDEPGRGSPAGPPRTGGASGRRSAISTSWRALHFGPGRRRRPRCGRSSGPASRSRTRILAAADGARVQALSGLRPDVHARERLLGDRLLRVDRVPGGARRCCAFPPGAGSSSRSRAGPSRPGTAGAARSGRTSCGNEAFNQPDGCSLGGYSVADDGLPAGAGTVPRPAG